MLTGVGGDLDDGGFFGGRFGVRARLRHGPITRRKSKGSVGPGAASRPASLQGANGSRACAPDDRLRDEAIQSYFAAFWIASLAPAMTCASRGPRLTQRPRASSFSIGRPCAERAPAA